MTNKYKCSSHKLDFICRGCVRAWIARHNKLLEFVKEVSNNDGYCFTPDAKELLKEIGE